MLSTYSAYSFFMYAIQHKRLLPLLILGILFFGVAKPAAATVGTYPATPGAERETRITGFAENKTLIFEKHITYHPDKSERLGTIRTRFSSTGPVIVQFHFTVPYSRPSLRSPTQDLPLTAVGQDIAFQLPGPGHYIMKVTGISEYILIWVDDGNIPNVQATDPGVVSITSKGVTPDLPNLQTAAIQAAIRSCPNGCILYFPPGTYRTGSLTIDRSDITLYFAAGSLLKGSENACDYSSNCRGGRLIYVDDRKNIKFRGKGTIDASGMATYKRYGEDEEVKIHNVDVEDSDDILFEDLLFMDSNSWGIHLRKSEGITIKNLKVFSGKDGIDPDSSKSVTIDTVFIQSIDDSVAVKARFEGKATRDVAVRNCMVQSRATALKIGTEIRAEIKNISFSNCMIFDSDRKVTIPSNDNISNAHQSNIRIFDKLETDAYKPVGTAPPIQPPPSSLMGDIDRDHDVDIFDYNALLSVFGRTGSPGYHGADVDIDGDVDIFDYNALIGNFGKKE